MPNVRRAATTALLGKDTPQSYTEANITGAAQFGSVDYADIACAICAEAGQVVATTCTQWYNFSARFTDFLDAERLPNISTRLDVSATLNNGTHFLHHACAVRLARGLCAVALVAAPPSSTPPPARCSTTTMARRRLHGHRQRV
jgi:hypothetical protein